MFNTIGSILETGSQLKQVRGLATPRFPDEPELPTVAEAGRIRLWRFVSATCPAKNDLVPETEEIFPVISSSFPCYAEIVPC